MKPNEINAEHDSENILKYIDNFDSIECLIFDWLKSDVNNSFTLGNGIDDNEDFTLVCLVLESKLEGSTITIAELYYDLKEMKILYNDHPLFETFVTVKADTNDFNPLIIDEKSLKKFEDSVGFYFDDYLYGNTNDTKNMLPYLMTFALSAGGGASIQRISKEFLKILEEDAGPSTLNSENILGCHTYLKHKNFITNGNAYFINE